MAGERLVKIMQSIANNSNNTNESTDLMFGEVTSTSPLKIKVDGRFEIDESFIILSKLCKPFRIGGSLVWDGLKKGEKVRILRCSHGQVYYVLEREE